MRIIAFILACCTIPLVCLSYSYAAECPTTPANGQYWTPQEIGDVKVASEQVTIDSLLDYDFTEDVGGQLLIDWRHASERVDSIIGIKALAAVSKHPKDEDILGIKMVGDLYSWTLDNTVDLITMYIVKNGEVPASGAHLFGELDSPDYFESFSSLYPTQRMMKYGPGVNLATNRFYQTFSDPEWHPGGIYVKILEPLGDSVFQLPNGEKIHFGTAAAPENVDGAFYYCVFSGAEGHVLFEDYGTFEYCHPEGLEQE